MIILGSKSKARLQLLKLYNAEIEVRIPDINETFNDELSIEENLKEIASKKAAVLKENIDFNDTLVCADTVVVCQGEILGKPSNYEEAFKMIKMLSGRKVDVITGVYLSYQNQEYNFSETTTIQFDEIIDEKIKDYLNSNPDYINIAGALDIDIINKYVNYSYEGSYSNIIGLPMERVSQLLCCELDYAHIKTPVLDPVGIYRSSVRAIIKKDNKIGLLKGLTFDKKHIFYMSVGGGYHCYEDQRDILKKEIVEEAGLEVDDIKHLVDAKEYTYNSRYINFNKLTYHSYFVVEAIKEVENNYIGYEQELLLGVEYFNLNEALAILTNQMQKFSRLNYPVFNMTYCDIKALEAYWGVINGIKI